MGPTGTRAGWLLLAMGLGLSAPVRAQTNPSWLLVPVVVGGKLPEGGNVSAVTDAIEKELRGRGQPVLDNDGAAGAFERQHSAAPVQLGDDQLQRLSKNIAQASRHLALGDLPDAQRAMQGVEALSEPARDFLNRDPARARKIYDNCWMAAYLRERANDHPAALRQILECTRSFPSFRPEGRAYPAEVGRLFDETKQQQPAALRVESVGRTGCSVRLNGVEVGKTPVQLAEVRTGTARVQLECEPGGAGRIHTRTLEPRNNDLSIDPRFDAAVQTQGGLWLSYANESEREARTANDLKRLGEVAGTERIVALWVSPGALGQDLAVRVFANGKLRELARTSYAADSGYARGGASKLASALVGSVGSPPSGSGPAAGAIAPADVGRKAGPTRSAAPPPASLLPLPPAAGPSAADSGGRPRYTQQHAAAGAILAVVGGAGTAVSWVVYAERQSERTVIGSASDETAYKRLGVVAISTAGVGTTLLSLSEYFWLPDHPRIPPLAWIAGGLGLCGAATALVLSLTISNCKIGDERVGCQSFTADHFFGPMLFLHTLPLLTAPLWYGLRMAFRPAHVHIAFATDAGGMPQLRLTGTF